MTSDPPKVKKIGKVVRNLKATTMFPLPLRSGENWKTATDVTCILDTLSSSGIDRIADKIPDEVFITTECPKRDYTFSNMPVSNT